MAVSVVRGGQLPAGRHKVRFEGVDDTGRFDDGSLAWRWVFVGVVNPDLEISKRTSPELSLSNQGGELASALLGRKLKRGEGFDPAPLVGCEFCAIVTAKPGSGGSSYSVLEGIESV